MAVHGAILIAHTHPQRALLPMGEKTLLFRMVRTFLAAEASPVIVTVDGRHAALSEALSGLPVQLLCVPQNTEMFEAVRLGIRALPAEVERAFLSPVCIPPFSKTLLQRMLACDHPVCRPVRGGIGIHPVLLNRAALQQTMAYAGEDGLRGALAAFPADAVCRLLPDGEGSDGLHPTVQVRIADGDSPFFGPGPRQLLLGIRARGSVAHACEAVGLSYSKGRALLRSMEQALGTALVTRTQGGTGGGSASLTPAGEQFLSRYACYEQAVADYAAAVFSDYFPDDITTISEREEAQI